MKSQVLFLLILLLSSGISYSQEKQMDRTELKNTKELPSRFDWREKRWILDLPKFLG